LLNSVLMFPSIEHPTWLESCALTSLRRQRVKGAIDQRRAQSLDLAYPWSSPRACRDRASYRARPLRLMTRDLLAMTTVQSTAAGRSSNVTSGLFATNSGPVGVSLTPYTMAVPLVWRSRGRPRQLPILHDCVGEGRCGGRWRLSLPVRRSRSIRSEIPRPPYRREIIERTATVPMQNTIPLFGW